MEIEQFYNEKRYNFVCFISELRAELSWWLSPEGTKYSLGRKNTYCHTPDYASFQGYKLLLKVAIAGGTLDSYIEKFLLKDRINVKRLPANQLANIKRYLEMFSEL